MTDTKLNALLTELERAVRSEMQGDAPIVIDAARANVVRYFSEAVNHEEQCGTPVVCKSIEEANEALHALVRGREMEIEEWRQHAGKLQTMYDNAAFERSELRRRLNFHLGRAKQLKLAAEGARDALRDGGTFPIKGLVYHMLDQALSESTK